jgi:hypothetical protein
MFTETARERTEELRKREAERYEALLRERLNGRYPNPSPEQKRKIEARVQLHVERHGATVSASAATEKAPLRRFEEQLQQRLATRYPDLSPDQYKRLQERIAQAVERQKGRIVQTRTHSLDSARSALRRAPGSQQREVYER